ncbi:hypothetical protein YC2023_060377 [Brassica napus]
MIISTIISCKVISTILVARSLTINMLNSSLDVIASIAKLLYVQGARKVGLFGVSKLGCTPRMIASHGGGLGCAAEVNKAVESFNKNLKDLVSEFNTNFNDAKITYVDIFTSQTPLA